LETLGFLIEIHARTEDEMNKIRFIIMLTLTVTFLSLLAAAPAAAKKPLHHASGDGFFSAFDQKGNENDFMFAFNARQLMPNGTAKGHLQHHNLTKGYYIILDIVHMEFVEDGDLTDDNTVGLIGIITETNNPNLAIGTCQAVVMQDNGEGRNAPDDEPGKTKKVPCTGPYSFDASDLSLLDGGNIQVR
jgi:hypothetical protein